MTDRCLWENAAVHSRKRDKEQELKVKQVDFAHLGNQDVKNRTLSSANGRRIRRQSLRDRYWRKLPLPNMHERFERTHAVSNQPALFNYMETQELLANHWLVYSQQQLYGNNILHGQLILRGRIVPHKNNRKWKQIGLFSSLNKHE